jgi:cytochrome c-type biogenesis protein CcmH
MLFWSILAVMTAATVFLVLRPLLAAKASAVVSSDDRAFYEAQLADIARDQTRGVIAEADAEAAKAEAARRLLRGAGGASEAPAVAAPGKRRNAAAIGAILAIPLVALPLYSRQGAPGRADMPHAARVAEAEALTRTPTRESIRQILAMLENDPRNVVLLEFFVPQLLQAQRYEMAANALTIIVEELGQSPKRLADLAAARGAAARQSGTRDPQVRTLLERALELDPNFFLARLNLGLVKAEEGDKTGALADLRAIEASLPRDAPVRPTIARLIKQIEDAPATPPIPQGGDAIAALPEPDREKAIRAMVDGLDQRLAADGGKPEEWQRLVRSYVVLKDADKAKDAYARARKALAENKEALADLDKLAKDLGLGI